MEQLRNFLSSLRGAQIKALIEKSAPKVVELKYGEDNKELNVKVYPVLPFMKRTEMIREIVDGVFMDEKILTRLVLFLWTT